MGAVIRPIDRDTGEPSSGLGARTAGKSVSDASGRERRERNATENRLEENTMHRLERFAAITLFVALLAPLPCGAADSGTSRRERRAT